MSRLIDADVFKENMDYICDAGGWLEPVTKAVREFVKKHIDAQTTVNPEPHWIPFHKRPLTKEEQKEHKDWCWILDCELPDDNQEVLISSPYFGVYIDTFYNDGECSFDGGEEIKEGMAWMPLPEPYQPKEDES